MCFAGRYTTVMYLEEDIIMSWPSLVAWAADQELLAPLDFQRGFQRTETAPWDGSCMLQDMKGPWRLDPNRTVVVNTTTGMRYFVNLPNPYSAMWIADMKLLQRFMDSSQWQQSKGVWGVREMGASGIQFLFDKPTPFFGSAVVPYDPQTLQLLDTALVLHISNNYCIHAAKPPVGFCSVPCNASMDGGHSADI